MEGGQLRMELQRNQRRSFQEGGVKYEEGVSIFLKTLSVPSGAQQFTVYNINEAT